MPPSPLMQADPGLMSAHLHQMSSLGMTGLGMIPRPNLSNFSSPFSSMATGKSSPIEHASLLGRHTPHSDGSQGSGSAGNGPTALNGTIEVKLEEVNTQTFRFLRKNCTSFLSMSKLGLEFTFLNVFEKYALKFSWKIRLINFPSN